MTKTKFGLKYYDSPSQRVVKYGVYLVMLLLAMADNISTLPASYEHYEFFKWMLICVKYPAVIFISHMFGKKSLNDIAHGKEN